MVSTRMAVLLAVVCMELLACSKHRRNDAPVAGTVGGTQSSDAGSSGAGGRGGGISGAGSSGSGGTATGAGGMSTSGSGGMAAGGTAAGEVDAGEVDAGEADAGGKSDDDCTIAYRMETCCFDAVAVTYRQLRADRCLTEYPGDDVDVDAFESCRPADCDVEACEPMRPPSYVAVPSANGCSFGDECTQASDCVFAKEIGTCCQCPHAMPISVALREACYVGTNEDRESSAACPFGCFTDFGCEACPEKEPTCVVRDSFSVCQ